MDIDELAARCESDAKLLAEIEKRYSESMSSERLLNQERSENFQKLLEESKEYSKNRFFSLEKQMDVLKKELKEEIGSLKNTIPDNSLLNKTLTVPTFLAAVVFVTSLVIGYYNFVSPIKETGIINRQHIEEIERKTREDSRYINEELKEIRRLIEKRDTNNGRS